LPIAAGSGKRENESVLMLKALRNRSIALLWSGQAASAIGDEIYRVALIWVAVGLIGPDTGYLAAGQAAALLTLSLVGGKWADHWDHFRTMIWVDALRAIIVLFPVMLIHFMPLSMSALWIVALLISALSAFFDPALQAMLPRFSPDVQTLQAATGLMSTTIRLARVAGPMVIGVLTVFIPTVHFFSLDSVTFGISALSIVALRRRSSSAEPFQTVELKKIKRAGFRESVMAGFRVVERNETMRFVIRAKCLTGGAWSLAYILGLALFAHQLAPTDVRGFGSVVAAYGVGNLASALILGNMNRKRPAWMMFCGYSWMGVGFLLMALSPNIYFLMLTSAFAAFGGPMNDLPFVDLAQSGFSIDDIPKIFRLRMAVETAATLVCMLISPMLFRIFSIQIVIGFAGIVTLGVGIYGLWRYSEKAAIGPDLKGVA
jgi:hypothetical protein